MTGTRKQARAVILALLMIGSVFAGSFAFGAAAATDNVSSADAVHSERVSDRESPVANDDESVSQTASGAQSSAGSTEISPAVRLKLQQSSPSDRIPVILIYETQPEDQLPLDRMTAAKAQRDMKSLAEQTQGPTLDYLETQATRGRATDIQPLYLRNAIAVKATQGVIKELASSQRIERIILDSEVSIFNGPGSVSGFDEFRSSLNETTNRTIDPTGFERVVESEPARGVEEIQADVVQDAGITGEGVNVSVIDTGINDSHPALEGQVILRKNFVNNETNVGDPDGHGTHVAGTVAGRIDAEQAVGVAPGANLFDARALDSTGSGNLSDIIAAFEWSANNSADVASASLGVDPIVDQQETRVGIDNGTSTNVTFEVYSNATGLNNFSEEGFQPAYVFVQVANATVTNDSSGVSETAAVENLSVTLRDPNGNEALEQNTAGFVYDGSVPDGQLLFKFTPSTAQQVADGNWSLTVANENTDTAVEVDVRTDTFYPPDGTDQVSKAVNNLEAAGTIPVVAAGNAGILGNRSIGSPAAAENAIAVGAAEPESIDVAPFSSRGPVGFGNDARPGVDLIAPGVEIVSAGSPQAYAGEEPYVSFTGTSMATPHVSGTIALLLDADPTQTHSDIETTLESTAQSPPVADNAVGAGALDAYAAVNSTTTGTPTPNQSVDNGIELYAGLGNTSDTNVFVDPQPDRDPVGDAGTAPDIEAAAVAADEFDAEFKIALANDTAPNATFVTYIDSDQNASTGDPSQSGAEYRLNLTRRFDSAEGYSGSIDSFKFNNSTGGYDSIDLNGFVDNFSFDNRPQYVEYQVETDDEFGPGIGTSDFDWHIVSQDPDSASSDRVPDTGQADTNYTADIDGIGVAWNSTAGEPAVDRPLQFRLYNETGVIIGNRTVRTDTNGLAETRFTVSDTNVDYTLEVESDRGGLIQQSYSLGGPEVDRGPFIEFSSGTTDGFTVVERGYETRPSSQVELNIPVYSTANGSIEPYEGPASIQFEDERTVDNLTVDNGTLTYTVDLAAAPEFGNQTTVVDFDVALTANFSNADVTYSGGDIDQEADVQVESTVFPGAQVTPPRTTTSVTFQTIEERFDANDQFRSRVPSEVNSTYEVRWVTDRVVASFYRELPDSVATKLASARQTPGRPEALTRAERDAVNAALQNISEQGTVPVTVTGGTSPERQGIGQFNVTPPEGARIGFVSVTPNNPDLANETVENRTRTATIYVGQRVDAYERTPTAPEQEERFVLDVDTFWDDREIEPGVFVPNESIEVTVELRDQDNNEPVPNTSVVLYTTGGETTTVTTDENGEARTTIPAPDLDYLNVGFDFEDQQVLGIAEGLQTSTGRSVSDIDTAFGTAFVDDDDSGSDTDSTSGVIASPSLSYDETNETLGLGVIYQNDSTFEETNATTSLILLGTPGAESGTQRDVFAGYLGTGTDTTAVSRDFSESVDSDRSKQYEVLTRTATGEFDGSDRLSLGGIDASIDAPREIPAGGSGTVAVTLTNRTQDPVTNATVALYYTVEPNSRDTQTTAGGALVGTTNASGVATFEVSPEVTDSFEDGFIDFEAGYATDTVADTDAGFGFTTIAPNTNITGSIQYNNGTDAGGVNITAVGRSGDEIARTTQTDSSGAFELAVPQDTAYDLVFSQDEPITDGVPDLYTFETTEAIESSTDVGPTTLPAGNVTTVEVTDQGDNPVADARVEIVSHGTQPFDSQRQGPVALTTAEGQLDVTGNEVELANNVTITAAPPENSSVFVSNLDQYTKQRNITENTSVNVTLVRDTTPPTVRVDLSETVKIGDPFVIDASNSTDTGTEIANYTFTFPNGESVTQPDPRLEVTAPDLGVQNITVTVTDNAGRQNSTTVEVEVVDTAPVIVTPPERQYDPTDPTTIETFHNATGVINSSDLAIRLVNVTNGTDEQVALNDAVPLNGTANTTIQAGTLSGNVTIRTQLYNNSSKQAVTNDTVELIAAPSDRLDTAPGIVAPPDSEYDPTRPFTIGTGHNASGVIADEDVAIRLVNVTAGNDTVVAVNDSVPVDGDANTTIPAGVLSGNVTIQTQLYNNSSERAVANDTVDLTAEPPTATVDVDPVSAGDSTVTATVDFSGDVDGANVFIDVEDSNENSLLSASSPVEVNLTQRREPIDISLSRSVEDETILVVVRETQSSNGELDFSSVEVPADDSGGSDPTATPTPTTTTATTTTTTTTSTTTTSEEPQISTSTTPPETTDSTAPGFGPLVAIVALLGAAALGLRRRD